MRFNEYKKDMFLHRLDTDLASLYRIVLVAKQPNRGSFGLDQNDRYGEKFQFDCT